jgi:RimJ/RimL family protein N-acetyltransferase
LYKKLGFVQEGTKRKEIYKNGVYIDSEIMSMLRDEYEKKFNK